MRRRSARPSSASSGTPSTLCSRRGPAPGPSLRPLVRPSSPYPLLPSAPLPSRLPSPGRDGRRGAEPSPLSRSGAHGRGGQGVRAARERGPGGEGFPQRSRRERGPGGEVNPRAARALPPYGTVPGGTGRRAGVDPSPRGAYRSLRIRGAGTRRAPASHSGRAATARAAPKGGMPGRPRPTDGGAAAKEMREPTTAQGRPAAPPEAGRCRGSGWGPPGRTAHPTTLATTREENR